MTKYSPYYKFAYTYVCNVIKLVAKNKYGIPMYNYKAFLDRRLSKIQLYEHAEWFLFKKNCILSLYLNVFDLGANIRRLIVSRTESRHNKSISRLCKRHTSMNTMNSQNIPEMPL